MSKGILYGVGVGPGDPKLMTLGAYNIIKDNEIIAVVGSKPHESVAYNIAKGAVPDIADKTVIGLDMPMSKDKEYVSKKHEENAKIIESYLIRNKNVVFLTLGDVSLYSTFAYLCERVQRDGFTCEKISGIPAFIAALTKADELFVRGNKSVHILTGESFLKEKLKKDDCYVIMKPAGNIEAIKHKLRKEEMSAYAVSRCTMDGEQVYKDIDMLPEDAGYFTVIITM